MRLSAKRPMALAFGCAILSCILIRCLQLVGVFSLLPAGLCSIWLVVARWQKRGRVDARSAEQIAADERLRVLFEHASDAQLLVDSNGIVDCNPAAVRLLGYGDKAELLAQHPVFLSPEFQPDGRRSKDKALEMGRLARENGHHRFEWMHRRADGVDFAVEVTLTPVRVNGRDGVFAVLHDLTERKQVEDALRASESRLRDMVENLPAGAVFVDGERLFVNRAVEELLGYGREELTTLDAWFETNYRERAAEVFAWYRRDKAAGFLESPVVPMVRKDGSVRHVQFVHYIYEQGEVWLLFDVTERMRVEQALQESEAHLAEAQRLARLGSYRYSFPTSEIIWSDQVFRLFDRDPALGPPTVLELMEYYHPEDHELILASRQAAFEQRLPYEFDVRIRQQDGTYRWCHCLSHPIIDDQGRPLQIIGTVMDITERKLAQQQIEAANAWLEQANQQLASTNKLLELQMLRVNEQAAELETQKAALEEANRRLTALATSDGLTGLLNHRGFREKLTEEFERTQRYKTPLSVILLDVDDFKSYNDTFGHPEGDRVLKTVAALLQQTARMTDIVCRYGGEEFVILLPGAETDGAIEAAERFRLAIQDHPWPLRSVTASFGAATLCADLNQAQELIDQADQALYAVKKAGKNRAAHAGRLLTDEAGKLQGDFGQPYTAIIHEMLQLQQDTATSATEQVREILARAYDATIESWSRLLDMKDKETEGHSARVTHMTEKLTECIGMNAEERLYARWGALLHDVGKMGVPDAILHKPGPLTEEEWCVMQRHTTLAYEMLSAVSFLHSALDIPYCHHEKWDGTGYPRGLKGEEIPLAARLFAVIDVYDALTSDRPYRQAWSKQKAVAYLRSLSGTHFDPRAVNVFLKMLTTEQAAPTALPASSIEAK